jgi:hypothetical protein
LFEVAVIDALNHRPPQVQHRLRTVLVKHGYDEHCARRVMSEDVTDCIRATALLSLLRPQWRDEPVDPALRSRRKAATGTPSRSSGSPNVE